MSTSVPSGRRPERRSLDSLGTELRPVLLAMAGGAVLLSVIVLLTFTEVGGVWGFSVTLVVGLVLVTAAWLVPGLTLSPLDPGERADPVEAARVLRSAGVLAMVLGEAPVLAGLVVSFVIGGWLPALVGGVLGTSALLILGPTKARLAAWKERLESRGARTGL